MKITRIDLWHVAVPTPEPFRPAWIPGFRQTENRFDLIRLTTQSGLQGWSAAPCMGKEREGLGALLGPYLLGERADDIANIRQRIREMSYLGWRIGWLEPACWDIIGKARNKPVYELLGGHGGQVKAYASTGEVRSGTYRIDEVAARVAEGFEAVKLRVHDATLEEDLAQIRQTRKGVGDDVVLGVDANQAWRVAAIADAPKWDYDRAYAFCKEAEQLGYTWVEEPIPMDQYHLQAKLRAATDINISGGELNSGGLPEFRIMLEKGCYDWYQPDAMFTGGIAETWAIIKACERTDGAAYSPHTWTNGIGFAVNLQLFGASPYRDSKWLEYPLDPPGWTPSARDGLLKEPWLHDRGRITLPTRPGLGFEIDRAALKRHGTKFFSANKAWVALRAVVDRGLKEAKHLGAVRTKRIEGRADQLRAIDDPALDALHELSAP